MLNLMQINMPQKNGGSVTKVITYHGNILFNKRFTRRLWAVGKHLGAWHILGFRFTFWYGNTSDINPNSIWYQKPLFVRNRPISLK